MIIRKVGIIPRKLSPKIKQVGSELIDWLCAKGILASMDIINSEVDMLVILGGDGTLLHVAAQAAELDIPVVGINLGDLGFLTEIAAGEMYQDLEDILTGDIKIERRMMLKTWKVDRDGQETKPLFSLNEVVVVKGSTARLLRLCCWAGEEYIATYKADGLIFSTPTGSTAYNLSAGGPVVHAELEALLVTPICPFMLESRPVLLGPETRISTRLAEDADEVKIMVDGRLGWILGKEDSLQIEAAGKPLLIISSPHKRYFSILRNKLNWSGGSEAPCLSGSEVKK